jgi:O-antigen/teichoic acid export membrane protein
MPAPDQKPFKPASGLTNSVTNVLGLLVPLAVFFGVTPYLVRGLGVAQFGVLTLFVTAVALLTSFDFGLAAGGVRSLGESLHSKGPRNFRAVARELWSAYLSLGITFAIVLFLSRQWLVEISGLDSVLASGWGSYALPVTIFFGFCSLACSSVPRAMEAFRGLTVIQVLTGSSTWIGSAILVGQGLGLDLVLLWFALMSALSFIALAWWSSRLAGGLDWMPRFLFPEIRKSLSYNLHAFAGQVASGATYHADKFLVSHFLGTAAVGYYGLATNISSKLLTLVVAMAGFVFPRSVRMFAADDLDGLRQTYLRATRYVLLLAWPMLVVAAFLGDVFLRIWVGEEFAAQAGGLLAILLFAYFVASLSVVASQVFNGIGNSRIGARFALLGAVINVLGCLILIPHWGLLGAALASLLSMFQVFGYTYALHARLELPRFPFIGIWIRLLIVALMQAIVLWLGVSLVVGWWSLLSLAFLGWAIFYLGWYVLPFADKGDRDILCRLWNATLLRIRFK